ncbi:unnamed protein product, partial [marine sediment metagenome]
KQLMRSIDVLHDLIFPKFNKGIKEKSSKIYTSIQKVRKESREHVHVEGESPKRFMAEILDIYRQLFLELCIFLESIGWLADEVGED